MNAAREEAEGRGQVAGSGSHFENRVGPVHGQGLQYASLQQRRQHGLSESDGDRRIGKRELPIGRRHKRLARYLG